MAMGETIVAAVAGVSGAGIGALAALLVQRAKRRDDADAAATAAKNVQRELQLDLRATARAAARAWLTSAERVISDLENGRTAEAQRHEEVLEAELKELTTALYRFTGREYPMVPDQLLRQPLTEHVTNVSHSLRAAFHRRTEARLPPGEEEQLLTDVRVTYEALNRYLVEGIEVSDQIRAKMATEPAEVDVAAVARLLARPEVDEAVLAALLAELQENRDE
ncbi:hypothetical protein [Streptomyces sp. NPDC050848]|uniref:hypothetical protein n=1 Tax=Streptomyces sp. NPDC050848 TaxID=3155791 RepID=UPI0033C0107E